MIVLKDLIGIFYVKIFIDLRIYMKLILLWGIDFINVNMKLICELFGLIDNIIGGCFLENGDIVLVDNDFSYLLYYSNVVFICIVDLIMEFYDVVC